MVELLHTLFGQYIAITRDLFGPGNRIYAILESLFAIMCPKIEGCQSDRCNLSILAYEMDSVHRIVLDERSQ